MAMNHAQARALLDLPDDAPMGHYGEAYGAQVARRQKELRAGLMSEQQYALGSVPLAEALSAMTVPDVTAYGQTAHGPVVKDLTWAKHVLVRPFTNAEDLSLVYSQRIAEMPATDFSTPEGNQRCWDDREDVHIAFRVASMSMQPTDVADSLRQMYSRTDAHTAAYVYRPINHPLHIVLSVLTGGLWLIPYAYILWKDSTGRR